MQSMRCSGHVACRACNVNSMQCAGGHATASSPGGKHFLVHNGLKQICKDLNRAGRNRGE